MSGATAGADCGARGANGPVLAASKWRTNAELIVDVVRLGHIGATDVVLDPTYGRGVWWKAWRPDHLVTHDIVLDGVDFRHLPEPADLFDVVAFDPPYVSVGGRATTTIPDMHHRFGLTDAPHTPAGVQEQINDGLSEALRVLRPRGICLVKCKDYVSSGRLWLGTHHTVAHALSIGFEPVDKLEHIGSPGPQPTGRRVVHARRNLSTLFVLRASSARGVRS